MIMPASELEAFVNLIKLTSAEQDAEAAFATARANHAKARLDRIELAKAIALKYKFDSAVGAHYININGCLYKFIFLGGENWTISPMKVKALNNE